MKVLLYIFLLSTFIYVPAIGQHGHSLVTKSFKVNGACDMCKENIEKAVTIEDYSSGVWDAEAHVLVLKFDSGLISADSLLHRVANAGYDNEIYRASDDVYESLPGCCQYERNEIKTYSKQLDLEGKVTPISSEATPSSGGNEKHDTGLTEGFEEQQLDELVVTHRTQSTKISGKDASLTYNINSKELLKAACCNLSESFQTNAAVDVAYSNAVTGTKQIKMLGLDQKYSLITKELMPEIRGLSSAYGLNFIPGRWINGIQLTKGTGSVSNGYESISGHINSELVKFKEMSKTSLNFYGDNNSRMEGNLVQTFKLSKKLTQSILLHANATPKAVDHNDDGFLDQPTGSQINLNYGIQLNDLQKSGIESMLFFNVLKDNRMAGQVGFNPDIDRFTKSKYGVDIDINRFQIANKTGIVFKGKPYQSIGWMNQFTAHKQNSYFGDRVYNGKEYTYYSNLLFENIVNNTNHKYKLGASFLYDNFNEDYVGQNYKRVETVPGVFGEYTYSGEKLIVVAGVRADFHNLAGTQITPRANVKYNLTETTTLRASAGRGFRTANVFAENQQYMASNRAYVIRTNSDDGNIYGLKPEIAWNYGVSLEQTFKLLDRPSSIVVDFFKTDFQSQVVVDMDASTAQLYLYNLDGRSFSNTAQIQWDWEVFKRFDMRLAYKWYDVKTTYDHGLDDVPFIAKSRAFVNFGYSTRPTSKDRKWSFDATMNFVGKQRLPNTDLSPVEYQLPDFSDSYSLLHGQIAFHFNKTTRIYLGGDNLLSYTQHHPIIGAKDPFNTYFDGSMIYAPIMPANVYIGLDIDL